MSTFGWLSQKNVNCHRRLKDVCSPLFRLLKYSPVILVAPLSFRTAVFKAEVRRVHGMGASTAPSRGGSGRQAFRTGGRHAPTPIFRRARRVERGATEHGSIHRDDSLARAAGGGGRSRGSGAVGFTHDGRRAWGNVGRHGRRTRRAQVAPYGVDEPRGKQSRRELTARSAPGGEECARHRVKAHCTNSHAEPGRYSMLSPGGGR